jgi:hypothetical protein
LHEENEGAFPDVPELDVHTLLLLHDHLLLFFILRTALECDDSMLAGAYKKLLLIVWLIVAVGLEPEFNLRRAA